MKIAIVASLLRAISAQSTGGTEVFTHLLTEGLVKENLDVTLFATADSQTSARLRSICDSHQTTGVFEGSTAANLLYELIQSQTVIKHSHEFDVIHNNRWSFYNFSSFTGLTSCPVITTVHNQFWHYPHHQEILRQTHQKGKDIVVFVSRSSQSLLTGELDSEVIYNGIDIESFPFSSQTEDYVLWLSRMDPNKGIKPAMEAAQLGNFKLIVSGTPPLKPHNQAYIQEQVTPYFSSTIQYDGPPSLERKRTLYQKAKALLFPTLVEEPFGLVMVEAMASGTPVVAYNRGAIPEVIKDGITGFIVDPDDAPRPYKGNWIIKKTGIEGLVEAVGKIHEIDRAACRAHVEQNFTLAKMVAAYQALYQRVKNR